MAIQTKNGASVCTPDKFAIKQREARLKRLCRTTLKKHEIAMNKKQAMLDKRIDVAYGLLGVVVGLLYMGVLLGISL